MKKNKFKFKVFTSFCLFLSFPVMTVSGIILFLSPKGRIANWIEWSVLGITREGWSTIHIVFMVIFLAACILHIFWLNWKVFWSYVKQKSAKGIRHKKEFWWSIVLTGFLIIGIALKLPPVYSIYNLSESIKASYETVESTPPVPHAESLTLVEFSKLSLSKSAEEALKTIKGAGYKVTSTEELIGDIAENNNITPSELYRLFSSDSDSTQMMGSDSGYGRKTLSAVCLEFKLNADSVKVILEEAGFSIDNFDETLKQIAEGSNRNPIDIINIMSNIEKHRE